ncbi:MAG: DUF2318 domain-containing protein, partial [Haemophilus parainfluenzae]|nr:DUF2318 domain-containing protein [Haemophilus parainfluenzae]
MNYFFTFFLQALLPFSLLLGVYHSKQSTVSAKKIIWLSLFGFIAGIVLLVLNGVILALLFIFALCLIFGKGRLPAFWQTVLMLIAGSFWAKDPNITALVSTDVINTDSILHISAVIFAFVFCLCLQGWIDLLLKQAGKTQQK